MRNIFAILIFLAQPFLLFSQTTKRNLIPGDIYKLQTIGDPQVSPEGNWVLYTLSSVDSAKDKRNTDIWMISWDGQQTVRLTDNKESQNTPRWSPDGKYISFLSSRMGGSSQVWLMDRRGGEASKLTDIKGEISTYSWSPNSKKLALVIRDPLDTSKNKTPGPYIINRYRFKQDVSGYQYENRNNHLYVFDISEKKLDTITKGNYNESDPQWSPNSSTIAFVSNQTEDVDRNTNNDIFLVNAAGGSNPRKLTTWKGSDISPRWSPDGKHIAYLRSTSDENYAMYDQEILCVSNLNGEEIKLLSKSLDRPVSNPTWSKDGNKIGVLVSDDLQHYVAEYEIASGKMNKISAGEKSFTSLALHPSGSWLTLMSHPQLPSELYAIENTELRRLTYIQNKFADSLSFAAVSKFVSKSRDGASISGLLFLAPNERKEKLPLIVFIHGGPVAQDEFSFDLSRQMLAARGYAVAAVNYRGSSGRGIDFSKSIYADWGNKEVMDVLGAVDHLVSIGVADPERLGIGGWSYGGILTNYTIATDNRFKAASSGAGSSLQLSLYGVDQYILQLDNELGQPWKNNNFEKYLKLSYPFLHADKIKTPTQFLSGEKDFNVPTIGSEQMYQALRSQGIPTELLIYPGQFHGFTRPSFIKDRFERYYQWFDKYLKPTK